MDTSLDETLSRFVTAFHVLHQHRILDEYGQISMRNPHDPSTFFTSNVPAILVSSKNDLNEWNVLDGSPVPYSNNGCPIVDDIPPNSEHYIHSCIYDLYPGVGSIIHSHNLNAVAYGLCNSLGSLMQPSYQMAGFVGSQCPIFNAADHYSSLPPQFPHNLAINHKHLGDALAQKFSSLGDSNGVSPLPSHAVVFLRGHGMVTWATGVEDAVYRAIHICRSAIVQTAAMTQRGDLELEVVYLSERETRDCEDTINRTSPLVWAAWVAEVERSGYYHNDIRTKSG